MKTLFGVQARQAAKAGGTEFVESIPGLLKCLQIQIAPSYMSPNAGGGGLRGSLPMTTESIAMLPLFGPIEEHKWFFQISSQ
jgi:hypothetical protein